MGVERIGDESADADAELLAMTVECLLAAGLTEFQVSVGQVDYFKSLLKEAELDTEAEETTPYPDLPEKFLWCRGICGRAEIKRRNCQGFRGNPADVWFRRSTGRRPEA